MIYPLEFFAILPERTLDVHEKTKSPARLSLTKTSRLDIIASG